VISKAEAGDTDFIFKQTDLSDMVKEACDLFGPLAEDKHIEFFRQIDDNIVLSGDIRMLQRAFSNLLDNAIKYTPENGKICVQAGVKNNTAVISIEDTGTGIAPEFLEKIFERFYRAESSRTSSGTGLGLSLARTIVRRHNGDIRVSSRPGRGSVFSMTLPINNFPVI
jgi:signal transduction histidine kinase